MICWQRIIFAAQLIGLITQFFTPLQQLYCGLILSVLSIKVFNLRLVNFLSNRESLSPNLGRFSSKSIKPERSRITIYWLCQLALLMQDKLFKTRTVLSSELRAT